MHHDSMSKGDITNGDEDGIALIAEENICV